MIASTSSPTSVSVGAVLVRGYVSGAGVGAIGGLAASLAPLVGPLLVAAVVFLGAVAGSFAALGALVATGISRRFELRRPAGGCDSRRCRPPTRAASIGGASGAAASFLLMAGLLPDIAGYLLWTSPVAAVIGAWRAPASMPRVAADSAGRGRRRPERFGWALMFAGLVTTLPASGLASIALLRQAFTTGSDRCRSLDSSTASASSSFAGQLTCFYDDGVVRELVPRPQLAVPALLAIIACLLVTAGALLITFADRPLRLPRSNVMFTVAVASLVLTVPIAIIFSITAFGPVADAGWTVP